MNRKKGLLKREKMRKKQASGAVHATLTASTVNYCNI